MLALVGRAALAALVARAVRRWPNAPNCSWDTRSGRFVPVLVERSSPLGFSEDEAIYVRTSASNCSRGQLPSDLIGRGL